MADASVNGIATVKAAHLVFKNRMSTLMLSFLLGGVHFAWANEPGQTLDAFEASLHEAMQKRMMVSMAQTPQAVKLDDAKKKQEISRIATEMTQCAMTVVRAYPSYIQQLAIDRTAEGKPYTEVKQAMDIAIKQELATPGERSVAMKKILNTRGKQSFQCMLNIKMLPKK